MGHLPDVKFTCLVDGDSIHIGVIHKPDDLVGEEFSIVLGRQVRLSGLWRVELQTLADSLSQHIKSWVGLHYLRHGLLDQGLASREPVTISTVERETSKSNVCCSVAVLGCVIKLYVTLGFKSPTQNAIKYWPVKVVGQIKGNQDSSGWWVNTHVVSGVVQELGPGISLNIMGVVVTPSELNVNPVLLRCGAVHNISIKRITDIYHTIQQDYVWLQYGFYMRVLCVKCFHFFSWYLRCQCIH